MKGPNVAVAVIVFYHVLTRLRQYLGIHTTATIKKAFILGVLIIVECRSTWYFCQSFFFSYSYALNFQIFRDENDDSYNDSFKRKGIL